MASEILASRINVRKVSGPLAETNDYVGYRYRSGRQNGDTVRISITGDLTGDVELRVVDPGADVGSSTEATIIESSLTPPQSLVFEPGGSCDIYIFAVNASSGSAQATIWR